MPTASPTFLLCLHEGACLCILTYFWCFLCFFVVDWCNVSDSPLRIQHTHTVPSCKFRIFCLRSADDDVVVDQTGNAEYLTHHTVLSGCGDDDVEDFPPFPSRLTTHQRPPKRESSLRAIRLFRSSASSFVFFLLQSHSHTFGPSDIRHQEFLASVFRFSRKEMSSFRKETPCTVSVPSPTRPRGESFSLINALSSYNTSFSHDLLCFLDLPEPNNDNFPIGE